MPTAPTPRRPHPHRRKLQHGLLGAALAALAGGAWCAEFTVNSAGDGADANPGDGVCATAGSVCTLRAALQEANALAGADRILFHIGSGGAVTIAPTSALPPVTGPLDINGYSQPGASANTLPSGSNANILVRLDGGAIQPGVTGLAFGAGSNGSSVRGLQISRFGTGIEARQLDTLTVAGNFIGTDAAGTPLANGYGIHLLDGASQVTLGGTAPQDRNVVANSTYTGILISDPGTVDGSVRNNYIGLAPDGLTPRPDGLVGVLINRAASFEIDGNVISGSEAAIRIFDGARNHIIQGNRIGVGADGLTSTWTPASRFGIEILSGEYGAPDWVHVGGNDPGEENIIAYQGSHGIRVNRVLTTQAPPTNINIASNSIHDNGGLGIDLADQATGQGVDLPNANDPLDGDKDNHGAGLAFANTFQNHPVPISAITDGSTTTVGFMLQTRPGAGPFRVQAFVSPSCDPSGFGEGHTPLDYTSTAPADGAGNANGTLMALPATTPGHFITLIATDTTWAPPSGTMHSSEFSPCQPIVDANAPVPPPGGFLRFAVAGQTVNEADGTVTVLVQRVGGASGQVMVDYATAPQSATSPADFASGSGTLVWPDGDITPKAITIALVDDAIAEGNEQFIVTLTDNAPTDTGALGSPATHLVTIVDDDSPPPAPPVPVPAGTLAGHGALALLTGLAALLGRRRGGASTDRG